jgi:hypothetical protein
MQRRVHPDRAGKGEAKRHVSGDELLQGLAHGFCTVSLAVAGSVLSSLRPAFNRPPESPDTHQADSNTVTGIKQNYAGRWPLDAANFIPDRRRVLTWPCWPSYRSAAFSPLHRLEAIGQLIRLCRSGVEAA